MKKNMRKYTVYKKPLSLYMMWKAEYKAVKSFSRLKKNIYGKSVYVMYTLQLVLIIKMSKRLIKSFKIS